MDTLERAVALAGNLRHVLVATADEDGLPHIASAGRLNAAPGGHVALAEWFCPGTLANLQQNRRISIVVWDAERDIGYQLLGEVEEVRELEMLDGYVPGEENRPPLPQVERELLVNVTKILAFSQAPHSDVAE
jgi:predicted pyridoxine 5'-phosphate oxidase superfamily flavin-nucleotide-binding protein